MMDAGLAFLMYFHFKTKLHFSYIAIISTLRPTCLSRAVLSRAEKKLAKNVCKCLNSFYLLNSQIQVELLFLGHPYLLKCYFTFSFLTNYQR